MRVRSLIVRCAIAVLPIAASVPTDAIGAPGGRIRGTVTDQATGSLLSGVNVHIVDSTTREQVTSATTNALGQYTTAELATGTYYAFTSNDDSYLEELYDNIECVIFCPNVISSGPATLISVTAAAITNGVNFALVKGASISGTVTDATTGMPLADVQVVIADAEGHNIGGTNTTASGSFLLQALRAGTYYLFTSNGTGYINERWNNVACGGICQSGLGGTPIVAAAGTAITGKNFALMRGGRISGTVRAADTLNPLEGTVYVYSSTAALASEAAIDASGNYFTYAGLPTGTYYAVVQNQDSYVNEIYDNVVCPGNYCEPTDAVTRGTPIAVTVGATTAERNFLLTRGGRIRGRVTNAATGTGVSSLAMYARTSFGQSYNGQTDASGNYEIEGLPPGPYEVHTSGAPQQGLVNEVYNDVPCIDDCGENSSQVRSTKINVTIDSTTSGIDFVLAAAGTARGRVTNATTGAAVADVAVYVFSATLGTLGPVNPDYAAAYTDGSGDFTLPGLPTGNYFVYTVNSSGLIDEAFANLPCLGGCPGAAVLGTPISVSGGSAVSNVDFALDPGARISGVLRDVVTGDGVDGAIEIVDPAGRVVETAFTAARGEYTTTSGLAAGTYYAVARVEDLYLNEVYGGAQCPGACSPETALALGTPIVVAAGATTSGRDFALERGSQIAGTVLEASTAVPIVDRDRTVNVYDSAGRFATMAYFNDNGEYLSSPAVPSGTYFAFTTSFTHANEIYDDIPCPTDCSPSKAPGGTPIVVTAGTNANGRNFALARRGGVPGAPSDVTFTVRPEGILIGWQPPESGGFAAAYRLEAGVAPGTTAVSFTVNEPSLLAAGAGPGQYFIRVKAMNASGIGPPSQDAVLAVGSGGAVPGAPHTARAWMTGSRLMMTWDDPGSGGVPTHYLVEAGTAAGLTNVATISSTTRGFTYPSVSPGFYFLRVRAVNAAGVSAPSNDVMLVAGGAASPPRAPRDVGAAALGSTVTLTWSPPAGSLTGSVIEAGSAPGLSNLATLVIGPVTTMTFNGVPPGTYYVRIRSVNALGRSVASEEITVVVG